MENKDHNLKWQSMNVNKADRHLLNGHKSCVLWFTGLSGSGKSTLAVELESLLFKQGIRSYILDGDNIRHGLNRDLGFSPDDRKENIRRIGEVANLFVNAGLFTITAFISPYRDDRETVKKMFQCGEFVEVYVKCPLDECERRDPKGQYLKARKGEIKEYTGISAPYEAPETPEIILETDKYNLQECIKKVIDYLIINKYI
jgi:adenylylsulfate kinase